MFSHFTLGTNDLSRAQGFYLVLMDTLGLVLIESKHERGYAMFGPLDHSFPHLFINTPFDNLPATCSNGFHIAFNAPNKETVDRFHTVAIVNGGYDEGPPGIRNPGIQKYAPDYYAAYVRDPDGNKLQAVCYTNGRGNGRRVGYTGNFISHITLGCADLRRERSFYQAVLTPLGYAELPEASNGDGATFGIEGYEGYETPVIFVQPTFHNKPVTRGNGTHTALHARSRNAVQQFYAAAQANGGTCEGPPGLRPHYSEHYYAAYVRDAVGNKLQAVYRGKE